MLLTVGMLPSASAKGSPPPSPCSISYLNCPTVISNGAGTLSDELVNNTFDAATLGIAYSVLQLPVGDTMSFTLAGPAYGANRLPFLTTAVLSTFDSGGASLLSLKATNFDPSGSGSDAYLTPVSLSQGGVTLDESASGFEGPLDFQVTNLSGASVRLLLDVQIHASGYGQVTVTNTYALSAVPEPATFSLLLAGLPLLLGYRQLQWTANSLARRGRADGG